MDDKELTADTLESVKEENYRQGWEDGFNYALSLMNKPIHLPDSEVKDKIRNSMDSFLMRLKW